MPNRDDLSGMTFGRLTVLDFAGIKNGRTMWNCLCECGNKKIARGKELKIGHTKSCGCLNQDNRSKLGKGNITHGDTKSRVYQIWRKMKSRCEKKDDQAYKHYGGRGITVCEEWHDYLTFKDWALSHGYRDDLSIDRINNDGDYEPHNCKWSTHKEQQRNKRSNVLLTYNGETHCLGEWSEITGMRLDTLWKRVKKYNFTNETAISRGKFEREVYKCAEPNF